ncbi:hypothetical protein [Paenibacillus oceani]|uniref:Uncharacterized protein n=1 Tax=Paenibacillus oceani TaxID=2772510 RepID=A0A927C6S9_9BACL|nr:hypothetical protein [Paenibacillus oceani]MBD2862423.1 hypothetical protein [Paenibacillus oceani]
MVKEVTFTYKDSPKYHRDYATTVRINQNASNDLVLDFIEEYLDPVLLTKQYLVTGEEDQTHSFRRIKDYS